MKKRTLCALLAVLLWVSLLPVSALAAEDTVAINETNFPDNNFRDYVSSNFDINGDGSLSETEIAAATEIIVGGRSISDLTGIKYITALNSLDCYNNQLTSLDVSKNTGLKTLWCYVNQIKSLDISRNPHLLEAYIKGEKKEYSRNTKYSVSGKILHVDLNVRIDCLSIDSQPNSQTVAAGRTATFSVKANGYDLQYQWYVQKKGESTWTELTGETKQELTVTAAKELDGSSYRCEITGAKRDGKETLTSEAATLTIISKPKITTQPKKASVKAGKKVTFKVKASGGSLTYQWYRLKPGAKKWEKIKKATKSSYSFKAAKKWNGYKYKCLVKNKAGKVYTKAVKLTVK